MILVVGATGELGSEICRQLTALGEHIRVLVRHTADPARRDALAQMGAELVYGDLRDRASLDTACIDVTTIISTATTTRSRQSGDSIEITDHEGQISLVEAAKAADVAHFIYLSYSKNIDCGNTPCPLTLAKRAVEQRLRISGITYNILRPSFFMETWLSPAFGFDSLNAKATIYGHGHNPISYIALDTVAEFAVHCLDHPAARNAVLELGGPEPLSPLEVVKLFEALGGRPFATHFVPVEALQAQKVATTDSLSQSLITLMLAQASGDHIDMHGPLKVFPIPLLSVRDYASRIQWR